MLNVLRAQPSETLKPAIPTMMMERWLQRRVQHMVTLRRAQQFKRKASILEAFCFAMINIYKVGTNKDQMILCIIFES